MSLKDYLLHILRLDGVTWPPPQQPVEGEDATAFQAALVSENRVLRAELQRNGYSALYIDHLVRTKGART